MNIEQTIISLLMHDILSFNEFKITAEMFQEEQCKKYIAYLAENSGKKETKFLNQYYLSKINKNPNMFLSLVEVEKTLEVFDKKTLIELLYKTAIKDIIKKRIDLIENSFIDNTVLEEVEFILKDITNLIKDLNTQKKQKNPINAYKEHLAKILKTKADNPFASNIIGVSSGIMTLDLITKGFKTAEYIILAGRPSMGKTSAALDFVASGIKAGLNILVFSLEMPSEHIIARLVPKLNKNLNLNNSLYAENYELYQEDIQKTILMIENSGLVVEDFEQKSTKTILDIETVTDKYIEEHGHVDLVVIDYIQLLKSVSKSTSENTQTTDTSTSIKGLCKKTKAPWIVLSQLNRGLEQRVDKRPMNSDLRSSGSLEQDADIILYPYRENVYLERSLKEQLSKKPDNQVLNEALQSLNMIQIERAEIIVSKNRNGPTGTALVEFHKPSASYVNEGDYNNRGYVEF